MKILFVSTLKRNVSEHTFASRSRIIYQLTSGLAKRGHDISVLGTADSSIPGVTVIPVIEKGWVDLPPVENEFLRLTATLIQQTRKIVEIQDKFDLIHNHSYPDFFTSTIEKDLQVPLVTTLHALYDYYMDDLLATFNRTHFVALSNGYQKLYKKATIPTVIYNGVDINIYAASQKKKDYLLWLGRLPKGKNADGSFLDPKGVRWAIRLAKATGEKLLLSGVVEDKAFYEQEVKPHLNENIQWVGDVTSEQSLPIEKVVALMQEAKAFLMTVNQEEPFGLVTAEAMSCGTPVIAFDKGAISEIVLDSSTGYIVDYSTGLEGLVAAWRKLSALSLEEYKDMSETSRKRVEEHFTIDKMVENYEQLYQKILSK